MPRRIFEGDSSGDYESEFRTPGKRAGTSVGYLLRNVYAKPGWERNRFSESMRRAITLDDGSTVTILRNRAKDRHADSVKIETEPFTGTRVAEIFSWGTHAPDDPLLQTKTSEVSNDLYEVRRGFNEEDWQWLRHNLDRALAQDMSQDPRLRNLVRSVIEEDLEALTVSGFRSQLRDLELETGSEDSGLAEAWELVETELSPEADHG